MDFAALVVREGDRVTASGRLIRNHTGDWFEPPMPEALVLVTSRRARPAWRGAVRVTGADFGRLADRFEDQGAVEGSAWLTGIWSAGQLRAEHQASPGRGHHGLPRWEEPPCPAPAGGWPRPPRWRDGDQKVLGVTLARMQGPEAGSWSSRLVWLVSIDPYGGINPCRPADFVIELVSLAGRWVMGSAGTAPGLKPLPCSGLSHAYSARRV